MTGEQRRELCNSPVCRAKRNGKADRFLFAWEWDAKGRRIIVELPCPDCGTTYRFPIAIPEALLKPAN